MATATKTPADYKLTLELNQEEAVALRSLLSKLSGDTGRLCSLNKLFYTLGNAGVDRREVDLRLNAFSAIHIDYK